MPPAQQKPWRAVAVRQYSALLTAGRKGAGRTGNVAVRQSSLTSPVLQCDPPRTASGALPPRARRAGAAGPARRHRHWHWQGGTAGVRSGAVVSSASGLTTTTVQSSTATTSWGRTTETNNCVTYVRTYAGTIRTNTGGHHGSLAHYTHRHIDVPTPSFVSVL